jgi:hypothetical protein
VTMKRHKTVMYSFVCIYVPLEISGSVNRREPALGQKMTRSERKDACGLYRDWEGGDKIPRVDGGRGGKQIIGRRQLDILFLVSRMVPGTWVTQDGGGQEQEAQDVIYFYGPSP